MAHETIKNGFVLFWKGMLSQWHPVGFVYGTITFPTAEHWMMAEKARLFGDMKSYDTILEAKTPSDAKDLGRKVKDFNADIWDAECFGIVVAGNYLKFTQNPEARRQLLHTNHKILVEASPYDKIWGIGMGQEDPRATNPAQWEGKNLLGLALMSVRERL